jgi:hypothetical protein
MYVKQLDNLVFCWIKKALVKKFRYKGLFRPKWVAYHFMGLNKKNPNGKVWQIQVPQYCFRSNKVKNFTYIWLSRDIFCKTSILSYFLDKKISFSNYYKNSKFFRIKWKSLYIQRLFFNFKVFLSKNDR